jgi:hypothetical protein
MKIKGYMYPQMEKTCGHAVIGQLKNKEPIESHLKYARNALIG